MFAFGKNDADAVNQEMSIDGLVLIRQGVFGFAMLGLLCGAP